MNRYQELAFGLVLFLGLSLLAFLEGSLAIWAAAICCLMVLWWPRQVRPRNRKTGQHSGAENSPVNAPLIRRGPPPISHQKVEAHNRMVERIHALPVPIGRLVEWIYHGWLGAFGPREFLPGWYLDKKELKEEIERRRIAAEERGMEELHKVAISDGPAYFEALPNGEYVVLSNGRIHWSSSVLVDTFLGEAEVWTSNQNDVGNLRVPR